MASSPIPFDFQLGSKGCFIPKNMNYIWSRFFETWKGKCPWSKSSKMLYPGHSRTCTFSQESNSLPKVLSKRTVQAFNTSNKHSFLEAYFVPRGPFGNDFFFVRWCSAAFTWSSSYWFPNVPVTCAVSCCASSQPGKSFAKLVLHLSRIEPYGANSNTCSWRLYHPQPALKKLLYIFNQFFFFQLTVAMCQNCDSNLAKLILQLKLIAMGSI